jgi:hypothetical protein
MEHISGQNPGQKSAFADCAIKVAGVDQLDGQWVFQKTSSCLTLRCFGLALGVSFVAAHSDHVPPCSP